MHNEDIHVDPEWSHFEESVHMGDESASHPLESPSDMMFEPSGEPVLGPGPTLDTIGHPEADSTDWQSQGTQNGMCGPTSIAMVVNELGLEPGGQALSGADVAEWAIEHGDMTPDGHPNSSSDLGYEMNAAQISAVLEHYGVHNESVQGGSLQSLEGYLASGREVILGVDGDRIWHDLPAGQDAGKANHALVITGIDPKNGYAYVNDPGTPDGRMEAVPISVLMSAWSTSDYTAIVTDSESPDHQATPITSPAHTSRGMPNIATGHSGYTILPAMLHQDDLQLREDVIMAERSIEHDPAVVQFEDDARLAAQSLAHDPGIVKLEQDVVSMADALHQEIDEPAPGAGS